MNGRFSTSVLGRRLDVISADPALLQAIRLRLFSGRAPVSGGRRAMTVSFHPTPRPRRFCGRRPFTLLPGGYLASHGEGTLELLARGGGWTAVLSRESDTAQIYHRPGKLKGGVAASLLELSAVYLLQPDAHFLHSGAVARAGEAMLLIGKSNSGKSSLSLALARRGGEILSDELNAVRPGPHAAFVTAFPLRPQVRAHFFQNLAIDPARFVRIDTAKWFCPPLFTARRSRRTRLGKIVFVTHASAVKTSISAVTPDALSEVMKECSSGYLDLGLASPRFLDYLLWLHASARAGRIYRLMYSYRDFRGAVRLLEKAFFNHN